MRDFEEQTYVEVYGRPMYFASNMTGKPYGLLRYGYPDEGGTIIDNSTVSLPNQHYHPRHFDDDDFFEVNSATPSFQFQNLLTNYTFILWYSGRRW